MIQDKQTPQLPACSGLDVGAVAAFFKNNDTSYKFLWLLSILDMMEKSDASLSVDEIIIRMLNTAKPLIEKYRLRFGKKDRMHLFLIEQTGARDEMSNYVRGELLSFAPYRLLTSFFKAGELSKLSAPARHIYIRKNAEARFGGKNPMLYRFIEKQNGGIDKIEIDPLWREYLRENIAIVRGWVMWNWALFLESRNSNRPNIAKQILPEITRETLAKHRRFWRQVMGGVPSVKCLYSGKDLSTNQFALDHYIPFNFIGHNQLWNLLPVDHRVNSAKSDSLPHSCYFEGFVELQHTALTICRRKDFSQKDGNFAFAEYGEGLNIEAEKETDIKDVKRAYEAVILPLVTIARSYGFSDSWKYVSE